MIDDFINTLEDTFGKYKHGMRTAIVNKISDLSDFGFADLLKYLTEDYDMARPPSLKIILGECVNHNIFLNHEDFYGISICEFCGQEFSQNILNCPQCQKLRKYGLTKLVRYKPAWVDFEIDDEKRFIEKWNKENKEK